MLNRYNLIANLIESDAEIRALYAKATRGDREAENQYLTRMRRAGKSMSAIKDYAHNYIKSHKAYRDKMDNAGWEKHVDAREKLVNASRVLGVNAGLHLPNKYLRSEPQLLSDLYPSEKVMVRPRHNLDLKIPVRLAQSKEDLDNYITAIDYHFGRQHRHRPVRLSDSDAIGRTILTSLRNDHSKKDSSNSYITRMHAQDLRLRGSIVDTENTENTENIDESDEDIRRLKRAVDAGDITARDKYFRALKRTGTGKEAFDKALNDYVNAYRESDRAHNNYARIYRVYATDDEQSRLGQAWLKAKNDEYKHRKNLIDTASKLNINPGLHLDQELVKKDSNILHNLYPAVEYRAEHYKHHVDIRNLIKRQAGRYQDIVKAKDADTLSNHIEAANYHKLGHETPTRLVDDPGWKQHLDYLKKTRPQDDHNVFYYVGTRAHTTEELSRSRLLGNIIIEADQRIRELERLAKAGDPSAHDQYIAMLHRTGHIDHIMKPYADELHQRRKQFIKLYRRRAPEHSLDNAANSIHHAEKNLLDTARRHRANPGVYLDKSEVKNNPHILSDLFHHSSWNVKLRHVNVGNDQVPVFVSPSSEHLDHYINASKQYELDSYSRPIRVVDNKRLDNFRKLAQRQYPDDDHKLYYMFQRNVDYLPDVPDWMT